MIQTDEMMQALKNEADESMRSEEIEAAKQGLNALFVDEVEQTVFDVISQHTDESGSVSPPNCAGDSLAEPTATTVPEIYHAFWTEWNALAPEEKRHIAGRVPWVAAYEADHRKSPLRFQEQSVNGIARRSGENAVFASTLYLGTSISRRDMINEWCCRDLSFLSSPNSVPQRESLTMMAGQDILEEMGLLQIDHPLP